MRANQFIFENTSKDARQNLLDMFEKFLPLAVEILDLKSLPKIIFKSHIKPTGQPTFGMYVNGENILYVALMNRHPNDILRTVAHELTHYKQDTQHELGDESGETGSPEENDANARAGIIMRHFNKKYPQFLSSKPLV